MCHSLFQNIQSLCFEGLHFTRISVLIRNNFPHQPVYSSEGSLLVGCGGMNAVPKPFSLTCYSGVYPFDRVHSHEAHSVARNQAWERRDPTEPHHANDTVYPHT